ncbi:unnamed protein product [Plutella xylostella]|uniref:(diamondback moth) hypothetical protein n=1 Tax=Plutella xylostella TaxID=51655 RepID=A0A8S4FPL8_PLUXY|nr:unnamed protein product [Plutella xylostella]
MKKVEVPHTDGGTPLSILGDEVQIRTWQMHGLPRDPLSVESAVLMSHSRRWPLVVDPQTQANKWIRSMGKLDGLLVVKPNDRDLLRNFESALRFGKPILLENVGQELDPALDPVLKRQYYRQAGQLVLKLGDSLIPYSAGFRLYMTTKLPNPLYTPETSVKVQIVNFALVPSGLSEQLLSIVVAQERPDLEEVRGQLIISRAQMGVQLAEMQSDILYGLSNSEGSPVDDLQLITTLEAIKLKSVEIMAKVEDMEKTTLEIDDARQCYVPVANRGQILFFCLSGMANIDPMYQYSLEWFVKLFIKSMAETEPNEDIIERVETIMDHFTFLLYQNVCRSLFERHKLLFAFLMCARIFMDKGVIKPAEFHFFVNGGKIEEESQNPDPKWISKRMWLDLQQMASVPSLRWFLNDFVDDLKFFKTYYDSWVPQRLPFPKAIESRLDAFQKLIILKCLRADKVIPAMQDYVVQQLGARFVEPQPADLAALLAESDPLAPIIFVLSTGTDPAADLLKFAEKMKMGKRFESISLGQGQGPLAENMMKIGCDFGNWVFFQNCHLSPSWMPTLEARVEALQPELVHRDFRLWLTSTPSPLFPVALLQNGYKMTVEPPRGIKANLLKAYMNQVPDFLEYFTSADPKVPNFKWLLFSLSLFHGVVLERRKFGPLGFNIPYEFTDGDLRICISQLHMFLTEYADVPLRMLTYTAGHINYGGRVTDDWDRRCLLCLLADYYSLAVLSERHSFDEHGAYKQVLESVVLRQFSNFLSSNNLLNPLQSGFRPSHSTCSALIKITDDLRKAVDDSQLTLLTLLDFSNAFNCVDHDILLSILRSLNMSGSVAEWFSSYLSGRRQRIRSDDIESDWCDVTAGVPQGGVLSPILFSVFINTLVSVLKFTSYHLYADDLQLYVSCGPGDVLEAIDKMTADLDAVKNWTANYGLLVNPSKTQVMFVGSRYHLARLRNGPLPPVIFNGVTLPYCDSVKNLGLHIQNNLSWELHVSEISRKIYASMHGLKRLQNFLPYSTKVTLVNSLLLPIIDYADVCYPDLTEELLDKLDRLLNLCIRYIFGLRKFSTRLFLEDLAFPPKSFIVAGPQKITNFLIQRCLQPITIKPHLPLVFENLPKLLHRNPLVVVVYLAARVNSEPFGQRRVKEIFILYITCHTFLWKYFPVLTSFLTASLSESDTEDTANYFGSRIISLRTKSQSLAATLDDYLTYIRTLPLNDDPALFGLNSNANISYAWSETMTTLTNLSELQPKELSLGDGESPEQRTAGAAADILAVLPAPLDLATIAAKHPVLYKESLNTVLIQESIRYNKLLAVISSSLKDLQKALKGLVVMSEALEGMAGSLARNLVPALWSSKAYPSLKPLAAWVKDLVLRVEFMQNWADHGIPRVFWISGFYFPQAFLTGALQNYARKHVIAIDTIAYAFEYLTQPPAKKPEDGCCVSGLFLEGARWNSSEMTLEECRPKELHTEMAIIYMRPEQNHRLQQGLYECPAYKTLLRAGTLSTTGHSTNYVMTIELPTHKPQSHWIKRGVALFCALDY